MHIKRMEALLNKYKALTQECRLRIVRLLLAADSPLCICELMDILDAPQYQISRCLSVLKDAGLVEEERDGRLLLHSLNHRDPENRAIFESVESAKNSPVLKADLAKLKKRISMRENGKVVVTYT